MTVIGWHGDPCTRCVQDTDSRFIQRAQTYGLCARHWQGASEEQRATARALYKADDDKHAAFEAFYRARQRRRGEAA